MSDQKTTDLVELPAVAAPDDWVYIVDRSDPTDGASGSSRKIQVKNLVSKVLLARIENLSAGEYDFDLIPAGFRRLVIEGQVRGDVSDIRDGLEIFFNSDLTTSNYHRQASHGDNGNNSSTEDSNPGIATCPAASSPADAYGHVRIVVEDYAGSNRKAAMATYVAYIDTNRIVSGVSGVVWSSDTSAIGRIRIRANGHPTDQILGVLSLYGEY